MRSRLKDAHEILRYVCEAIMSQRYDAKLSPETPDTLSYDSGHPCLPAEAGIHHDSVPIAVWAATRHPTWVSKPGR